MPITPRAIVGHLLHVLIAGVGQLKFLLCPLAGHFPIPGQPRGISLFDTFAVLDSHLAGNRNVTSINDFVKNSEDFVAKWLSQQALQKLVDVFKCI